MCDIYNERPFDCRFFPFDILKLNGKFTWIIWQIKCPLVEKSKEEFKPYLEEHEQKLIPVFKDYLEDYSKFRLEEFLSKFQYKVLREVN